MHGASQNPNRDITTDHRNSAPCFHSPCHTADAMTAQSSRSLSKSATTKPITVAVYIYSHEPSRFTSTGPQVHSHRSTVRPRPHPPTLPRCVPISSTTQPARNHVSHGDSNPNNVHSHHTKPSTSQAGIRTLKNAKEMPTEFRRFLILIKGQELSFRRRPFCT